MTMKRWDGAAFIDVAGVKRWDGSAWVTCTLAKRWDGASWIDVALPGGGAPLSVTISPGFAYGEVNYTNPPFPTAQTVTSNSVVATVTGGAGTINYFWEYVSGSTAIVATNPNGNATQFEATLLRNRSVSGQWRCRVTRGAATAIASVGATLAYYTGNN